MKKTFKILSLVLISAIVVTAMFSGCGKKNTKITVVSREDGSGTRGASIELDSTLNEGTSVKIQF